MNIVTYNPADNPAEDLQEFFNSNFDTDKFFNHGWSDRHPFANSATTPRVNITETENEYTLVAEVPGLSEKDVNVEVHNDVLKLTGNLEVTSDKEEDVYRIREFHHESFERSFKLGKEVDKDKVTAKLVNGVLKVTLPKKAEVKAKKIDIQVNAASNN
jgi:HSP20 family protein